MILNLTQHLATPEQVLAGVIDLPTIERSTLVKMLTVEELPVAGELEGRCETIAQLAIHNGLGGDIGDDPIFTNVMIGGAPWMMSMLEHALVNENFKPVYAFSQRVSAETTKPDGTVVKTNVFKHVGFVNVRADGE